MCVFSSIKTRFISYHGIWIKFKRINETKQITSKMNIAFFTHKMLQKVKFYLDYIKERRMFWDFKYNKFI